MPLVDWDDTTQFGTQCNISPPSRHEQECSRHTAQCCIHNHNMHALQYTRPQFCCMIQSYYLCGMTELCANTWGTAAAGACCYGAFCIMNRPKAKTWADIITQLQHLVDQPATGNRPGASNVSSHGSASAASAARGGYKVSLRHFEIPLS